jgi:hypothetical protein
MSSTVDQLRALLSRVETRRNAPRLRPVPAASALGGAPVAPANDARPAERVSVERISAPPERAKPPSPTPLENAIAGGLSPTPVPSGQPSGELVLDDFEPPQRAVSRATAPATPRGGETAHRGAPTMPQTDPFTLDPFASSPPPAPAAPARPQPTPAAAAAPAAPAARPTPPTAPSARIAAPEPASSGPVARAVTRARVDTPRTFGELLELSLALRPRD